jgi:hypothetical protein
LPTSIEFLIPADDSVSLLGQILEELDYSFGQFIEKLHVLGEIAFKMSLSTEQKLKSAPINTALSGRRQLQRMRRQTYALYAVRVPQTGTLPPASFRFLVTKDTLLLANGWHYHRKW